MTARLFTAGLALAASGCAVGHTPTSAPASGTRPVSLTRADAGREVALVRGQRLVVSLAANPTTGYQWALVDAGGLVPVGEPAYVRDPAPPGIAGSGGTSVWTFAAERPGRGTLRLAYGRAFEPGVAPGQTFEVPVDVRPAGR